MMFKVIFPERPIPNVAGFITTPIPQESKKETIFHVLYAITKFLIKNLKIKKIIFNFIKYSLILCINYKIKIMKKIITLLGIVLIGLFIINQSCKKDKDFEEISEQEQTEIGNIINVDIEGDVGTMNFNDSIIITDNSVCQDTVIKYDLKFFNESNNQIKNLDINYYNREGKSHIYIYDPERRYESCYLSGTPLEIKSYLDSLSNTKSLNDIVDIEESDEVITLTIAAIVFLVGITKLQLDVIENVHEVDKFLTSDIIEINNNSVTYCKTMSEITDYYEHLKTTKKSIKEIIISYITFVANGQTYMNTSVKDFAIDCSKNFINDKVKSLLKNKAQEVWSLNNSYIDTAKFYFVVNYPCDLLSGDDECSHIEILYAKSNIIFGTNYCSDLPLKIPVANFTANKTTITKGESINFTDQSTNTPTNWLWDFGDGKTSSLQNPSHTYNSFGIYSVSLTASNSDGSDIKTKVDYISVEREIVYGNGVTDYNGNTYETIIVGNQEWMVSNLKATSYADGTPIPSGNQYCDLDGCHFIRNKGNYTSKYYFWLYEDKQNKNKTGAFYTWAAVMNGAPGSNLNPSNIQGVCPTGWHVPSDAEWKELESFMGMGSLELEKYGYRELLEVESLMSESMDGTNSTGFATIAEGYRSTYLSPSCPDCSYSWKNNGHDAVFWTSTDSSNSSIYRLFYNNSDYIKRDKFTKDYGLNVRCVKD